MIYLLLLFLCIIAFQNSQKSPQRQKIFAFVFLVTLMILVGIRDPSVGVDSERYADKLYFVKDFTLTSYEPLFQISINFVNSLWGSVLVWFVYLSFLAYVFYIISVLKFSANPILSVLVFMISFSHIFPDTMNNLRQGISIMILLLTYLLASQRKWLPCIPLFLLAAGFHMSSWFVLPFYYICQRDFTKDKVIMILTLTFLFGFVSSEILNLSVISQGLSLTSGVFMEGIEKYAGYTLGAHVLNWAGIITVMLPINILCYLLIPNEKDEESYKYLFNFYFWGVVIGNLIVGSVSFGMRYMVMFLVVESILVAYKYKKSKQLRQFLVFMVLFYCYYLWGISNRTDPGMIIPYKVNPEFFRLF